MTRLTKTYPDGTVTLDGSQFSVKQEVIDSNIRNSMPIKAAVERLKELEDRNEPKKPTKYTGEKIPIGIPHNCPTCGKFIGGFKLHHCCNSCGQALDWSEV